MKRKIAFAALALSLIAAATAVASDSLKYKGMPVRELLWNGKPVQSKDVPVVVMDGRAMIPVYLLRSVGYSVTSSGNKVVVESEDRNRKYLNNIAILNSFNKLLTGLRELDWEILLTAVGRQTDGGGIGEEAIKEINERMNALHQEYAEKSKRLDELMPIIDYPSAIPNESAETMNLYRQTVEGWTKFAASGSEEDLNGFLSLIREAQRALKSTQLAVDDYVNKNFAKLEQ
ncbi:hypothetical protein [Cohnella sp.]|uniref:hypothetical protein n=1 Tax=Cohnella sp. TaxID=1883426 RepID=UPI00356AA7E2